MLSFGVYYLHRHFNVKSQQIVIILKIKFELILIYYFCSRFKLR
jgi:hypothetical protein